MVGGTWWVGQATESHCCEHQVPGSLWKRAAARPGPWGGDVTHSGLKTGDAKGPFSWDKDAVFSRSRVPRAAAGAEPLPTAQLLPKQPRPRSRPHSLFRPSSALSWAAGPHVQSQGFPLGSPQLFECFMAQTSSVSTPTPATTNWVSSSWIRPGSRLHPPGPLSPSSLLESRGSQGEALSLLASWPVSFPPSSSAAPEEYFQSARSCASLQVTSVAPHCPPSGLICSSPMEGWDFTPLAGRAPEGA